MKVFGRVIVGLSVLSLVVSCSNTWERKGDSAYANAKRTSGDEQRIQQKTAYIMYQKAIQARPNRISNRTRDRFIELSLQRASMVLNEGNSGADAIPLYIKDIENLTTQETPSDLKQQYALFLAQLADSSLIKDRLDDAILRMDKAMQFAVDPTPIKEKKIALVARISKDNFELAQMEYNEGKANKDAEAIIRAEFHVQLAMYFEPKYPGAEQLLSDIRKDNKGTYSAYLRVIENIPDSAIFKKINKWDILMSVQNLTGNSATINIYNYSWDPLRMKSEHFALVDVNGNKYPAAPKAIDPEILDQEHEAKCTLSFPGAKGPLQMLIYQNGEHYSEKRFM